MMDPPSTQLERLIDERTVMIRADDIAGGSGFFVAPGVIVSCAHVVAGPGGAIAETVTVLWKSQPLTGRVRAEPARPAAQADGRSPGPDLWPYPDLCVIELDAPPDGQPSVVLGEMHGSRNWMYLAGFNSVYDPETFQGKHARLDGPARVRGTFWQVVGGEIAHGMSGGPVLDLGSGVVCAVTKTSRSPDSDLGGLVIPADAIKDAFPDVWAMNQEAARLESRWARNREALRDARSPLETLLGAEARRRLSEASDLLEAARQREATGPGQAARRHQTVPEMLAQLWREIAGNLAPTPDRPFTNLLDLASAVANLQKNGLEPVIKLFARLEVALSDPSFNGLHGIAGELAAMNGQTDELDLYIEELNRSAGDGDRPDDPARPVVVIRLDQFGPRQRDQLLLTAWSYPSRKAPGKQIKCALGPHAARGIDGIATRVVAETILMLAGRPMIEFALPDFMLDHAVEKWEMNGWPLSPDYPVVVRFGHRPGVEAQTWRTVGPFGSGRLPKPDSDSWDELWIDCGDRRTREEINGALRRPGRLPFVAMTAWHLGRPVPRAIDAARHAGASVILWRHKHCAEHRSAVAGAASASCRGSRFREAVIDRLSDVTLNELPEEIWKVRIESVNDRGNPDHPGHGIAILWDDPDRHPWADAPQNQAPSNGSGEMS